MFPVEAVALWVNRKPNKEFDLQMTGSQELLFWYKHTIISLRFFINLIRRKYFRIQVSMNTGSSFYKQSMKIDSYHKIVEWIDSSMGQSTVIQQLDKKDLHYLI